MDARQYDLERFVEAQRNTLALALQELKSGRKLGHWMWFVFPQIAGLGRTSTSRFYALADLSEARAFLAHALLGPRLLECTEAILGWAGRKSAERILGEVDALKLRSSMTLFEAASPETGCFVAALDAFYEGQRDPLTLQKI